MANYCGSWPPMPTPKDDCSYNGVVRNRDGISIDMSNCFNQNYNNYVSIEDLSNEKVRDALQKASSELQIDYRLVCAQCYNECHFNPSQTPIGQDGSTSLGMWQQIAPTWYDIVSSSQYKNDEAYQCTRTWDPDTETYTYQFPNPDPRTDPEKATNVYIEYMKKAKGFYSNATTTNDQIVLAMQACHDGLYHNAPKPTRSDSPYTQRWKCFAEMLHLNDDGSIKTTRHWVEYLQQVFDNYTRFCK